MEPIADAAAGIPLESQGLPGDHDVPDIPDGLPPLPDYSDATPSPTAEAPLPCHCPGCPYMAKSWLTLWKHLHRKGFQMQGSYLHTVAMAESKALTQAHRAKAKGKAKAKAKAKANPAQAHPAEAAEGPAAAEPPAQAPGEQPHPAAAPDAAANPANPPTTVDFGCQTEMGGAKLQVLLDVAALFQQPALANPAAAAAAAAVVKITHLQAKQKNNDKEKEK